MKPISSDDPLALDKLKAKLTQLEATQELMKAANKIVKGHLGNPSKIDDLVKLGLLPGRAARLLEPDFGGRIGFPSYELTNNTGNMARIRERIKSLEKRVGLESSEEEFLGVTFKTNVEANRLQVLFPGKPAQAIRSVLKGHGFHWSPTEGAWQRMLPVSSWVTDQVKEAIGKDENVGEGESQDDTPSLDPHPMDGRSYPGGY